MKKYLEDLRQELMKQKLTEKEIEEIIADHKEMISNAIDEGLSEEEIKAKFGKPSQVAEELADSDDQEPAEQEETKGFQLLESFEVKGDSISVDVNLIYEDITYQLGEDSQIKVFYQGKGKVEKYEVSYEKNEFRLSAPKRHGFNFFINKEDGINFLVELPRKVIVNVLKQVIISSDSVLKNLNIKQFIANSTSGDLDIDHCQVEKFKLHSVSGDSKIENSTFEDMVLSLVSGDVFIKNTTITQDFKASTVSGDVHVTDVTCVNFEMSAVSGDVNGKEFYPQKVIFKSVSGDLNIKNKEKKYIEIVKNSTLSGDINIS